MLLDEVDGDLVLCPPWNDDVGILLGGDAELLEGWLDEGGVLMEHVLQVATTFLYVSGE